jgi:iron(III)-salmochelin esterase
LPVLEPPADGGLGAPGSLRTVIWDIPTKARGAGHAVALIPGWAPANVKFPILIALHGRGEAMKGPERGAMGWPRDYALPRAFERLAAPPLRSQDFEGFVTPERLATLNRELPQKPFQGLVVLSPYLPDLDLEDADELRAYGEFLTHDLVPKAQASAPVFTSAASLGIDGVSLGGGAALRIGFMFPQAFGAVGTLQAAVDARQIPGLVQKAQTARGKNPKLALRLVTSDEDYFREALAGYDKALSAANVAHEFLQVPGPHDYAFNRGPGAFEMLLWHDRVLGRA